MLKDMRADAGRQRPGESFGVGSAKSPKILTSDVEKDTFLTPGCLGRARGEALGPDAISAALATACISCIGRDEQISATLATACIHSV